MIDKLGCHVGNNGDEMLVGSVNEALSYNANCFMLYLGAPQNTLRKPMNTFRIPEYLQILKNNNIDPADVIIHGPYILNFAQPDPLKRDFAVEFMSEEVKKAHQMGAKYVVFHPGAHVGQGSEAGCNLISLSIKIVWASCAGFWFPKHSTPICSNSLYLPACGRSALNILPI